MCEIAEHGAMHTENLSKHQLLRAQWWWVWEGSAGMGNWCPHLRTGPQSSPSNSSEGCCVWGQLSACKVTDASPEGYLGSAEGTVV